MIHLHDTHEYVDVDVEVAKDEAGRNNIIVDWDKVVAVHHSEKREEGIREGAEAKLDLPKEALA